MGRTAHHRARSRTWSFPQTTTDLRYSAACLADASGRPRPQYFRRTVHVDSYARKLNHGGGIGNLARLYERQARRRLRRELHTIRSLRERSDVDVTPVRHRHGAHWDSW